MKRRFRVRRLQLRLLTGSVAMMLGALGTVLIYPSIRDARIIRGLADADANRQRQAMARAVAAGRDSRASLRRLIRALDTENDRQFLALVDVLQELDAFDTPDRDPLHVDRIRALGIESARSPSDPTSAAGTRELLVRQIVLSGRDNRHVRRALAGTAGDAVPRVRIAAALLAARLKDHDVLRKLMRDPDANVAAAAALDAGLADMTDLVGEITTLLAGAKDSATLSAAAYALARLAPARSATAICNALGDATARKDRRLRNRLLLAAGKLAGDDVRAAVLAAVNSRDDREYAPAVAVLTAGKLELAGAAPSIERILSAAAKGHPGLKESQVLAALWAADRLDLPVRAQANAICRNWWHPKFPFLLAEAARVLGRQADLPQGDDANAPTREQCIATLRLAAAYQPLPTTTPATMPAATPATTPLPSAAAAAALWMLRPDATYMTRQDAVGDDQGFQDWKIDRSSSAFFVHMAAGSESSRAGDYLAWRIGRSGKAAAFDLGLGLLPRRGAPAALRVYNNNKRATGAMLLALAAGDAETKRAARERIRSRLFGGPLGGETDPYLKGSYHCALLILGEGGFHEQVRALLDSLEFPKRRVVGALCAAGDGRVLDWLLADQDASPDDVQYLLLNTGIGEILAHAAPQLPRVDAAADDRTRLWQVRILQDYYAIHRGGVRLGPSRQAPGAR